MKVKKEGWLFKSTVVVHDDGHKSTFSGDAVVTETDNAICVKESGFLSSNTACFIKPKTDANHAKQDSLPDGVLVGSSKNIKVQKTDGTTQAFESSPFSVHSMVKQGNQIEIKTKGLFGQKTVGVLSANEVSSISSSDCNVCRELNPLYD